MLTNAKVKTPIGEGVCQGNFNTGDDPTPSPSPNGEGSAEPRVLVRLPINDMTRAALRLANCLTPHASKSGLWVFPVSQTGGALLEFAILLALGLLCVGGVWLLLW